MWNGAAETLNARPARIIARPAKRKASLVGSAEAIAGKLISDVAPKTRADPKSRTADPKPPTMRYLSPASSDVSRSESIATRTYRQNDDHSRPRKSVIRSSRLTKKASPAPAVARSA